MKNKKNTISSLRFNLNSNLNNTMIEILIIKQMLEDSLSKDSNMTDKERAILYNRFEELKVIFTTDFRNSNKENLKIYNNLINK